MVTLRLTSGSACLSNAAIESFASSYYYKQSNPSQGDPFRMVQELQCEALQDVNPGLCHFQYNTWSAEYNPDPPPADAFPPIAFALAGVAAIAVAAAFALRPPRARVGPRPGPRGSPTGRIQPTSRSAWRSQPRRRKVERSRHHQAANDSDACLG